MSTSPEHNRILVVIDTTMSDARIVRPAVRAVAERNPTEVYVVAPILETRMSWMTNDDANAIADAQQRLTETLQQLFDRDVGARGAVAEDDAIVTVIGDALAEFAADEIIIALHAERDQHWREHGVAAKIRGRYTQPLTELIVDADGGATVRSDAQDSSAD